MFDFLNLTVYKKAKEFHLSCKRVIIDFKLDPYLTNQLSRASLSIPLNIAEGSGKFSKRDRRNFFVISRASIFECVAILDIVRDEKNESEKVVLQLMEDADELSRIIYTMIKNLS